MKKILLLLSALVLIACGGGGVGGSRNATLNGRVLQVETGGAPNPSASVQVGTVTVQTDPTDGTFSISVPEGATAITVDTLSSSGVWVFPIPPASGTVDVGDLWVGPDRVSLRGRVLKSTDQTPVSGATVGFGGYRATTNATGNFTIAEVAYSASNQTAFWGIVGTVRASGYFSTEFTASPNLASGGVVSVGDILLTPADDDDPPPPPYNLWGKVSPAADAPGTIVDLKQGNTVVRRFNVAANGEYYFWIAPGSYTIEARKGALTGTASASITATNQIVRRDVVLN